MPDSESLYIIILFLQLLIVDLQLSQKLGISVICRAFIFTRVTNRHLFFFLFQVSFPQTIVAYTYKAYTQSHSSGHQRAREFKYSEARQLRNDANLGSNTSVRAALLAQCIMPN